MLTITVHAAVQLQDIYQVTLPASEIMSRFVYLTAAVNTFGEPQVITSGSTMECAVAVLALC
jgi:hypothetical protein